MNWIHDFANGVVGGVSHAPGTQRAGDGDSDGDAVDLSKAVGQVFAAVLVGNIDEYTVATITAKLQESADGSTGWADVDGTSVKTVSRGASSITALEKQVLLLSAKNRSKRYVRCRVTVSGTEVSGGASPITEIASHVFAMAEKY